MKIIFFNYVIIIFYLISSGVSYSIERPEIKNLIVHKDKKKIENIEFIKSEGQKVSLNNYKSNPIIINFWATWCAPCIEEMPSLNELQVNPAFNNLQILPINVGRDSVKKSENFYKKLKLKNLNIYFDKDIQLANKFFLRGLPTTVFVNKKGEEFARIIGFVNFNDEKIIKWLKQYD